MNYWSNPVLGADCDDGRMSSSRRYGWTAPREAAAIAIVVAGILVFAALPFGFAVGTACTNHYNCSNTCVAACDRVSLGLDLDFFGQVGVIFVLVVALVWDRLHSVWLPIVGLALSMEMAWAAYRIAVSWSSVH